MQLPPNKSDNLFEKLLQDLPADLIASARQFKAFTRSRKLKTPADVLRAVLLYSGLDQSLREVAGTMTLVLGEEITDQAISDRLVAARPWMQVLLEQLLGYPGEDLHKCLPGRRIVAVDATQVMTVQARGNGYRIHTKVDLVNFEILELLVSDTKTGESLVNFQYQTGEVVIGDRAYIRRNRILELADQGVEVIGRFSPTQCVVEDESGQPIEWEKRFSSLAEGESRTLQVWLNDRKQARLRAWLHVYRKDQAAAGQARRKARRKAQQDKRTVRRQTLQMCDYVMVLTSICEEELSREIIFRLYRMRWQIELIFKRWKTLLAVAKLRCRQMSQLAWSWVYGKLLYCLLIERRVGRLIGWKQISEDSGRASRWRIWKMVREEVAPMISGSLYWQTALWQEAIKVLGERKRQRQLQNIPGEVWGYLEKEYPATAGQLSEGGF
jgi:hypothetical protein